MKIDKVQRDGAKEDTQPPPWFGRGTLSRFLLLYVVLAGVLTLIPSLVLFEMYRYNEFRGLVLVIGVTMMGLVMVVTLPLLWMVYRWASRPRRHVYAALLSCAAAVAPNLLYIV